ncbi:MAG TPA: hypothetical protein PK587_01430 [Syntrophales bacterium]|nr:hypothetical protein [Syntrophales bacterium]
MNVLFYAIEDLPGERLQRVIEAIIPLEKIERCRSINSLALRLRQPLTDPSVAVLLTSTPNELIEIMPYRELLKDFRIVLILPDRNPATVAMGHLLRPRFVSHIDGEYLDIAAVLIKMIGKLNNTENETKTSNDWR